VLNSNINTSHAVDSVDLRLGQPHQFRTRNDLTKSDKRRQTLQKRRKINGRIPFPTAHNGLFAGSSPAGPTKNINILLALRCPQRDDRTRYVHLSFKRTVRAALPAGVISFAASAMPAILRILRLPARSDHETYYTYAMDRRKSQGPASRSDRSRAHRAYARDDARPPTRPSGEARRAATVDRRSVPRPGTTAAPLGVSGAVGW
jgi:hypothetical protein